MTTTITQPLPKVGEPRRTVTPGEWADALESGEYLAFQGRLAGCPSHTSPDIGFCPLGVLAYLQGAPLDILKTRGFLYDRDVVNQPMYADLVDGRMAALVAPEWLSYDEMCFIARVHDAGQPFLTTAAQLRARYT